jgi:hypothetical protein
MLACPHCGAKPEDGFEVCWKCGRPLDDGDGSEFDAQHEGVITAESHEADLTDRTAERLVTIGTFTVMPEAQAMKFRLEAEGIRASLDGEYLLLANPVHTGIVGAPIRLLVFESDAERACRLLAEVAEEARPNLWDALLNRTVRAWFRRRKGDPGADEGLFRERD